MQRAEEVERLLADPATAKDSSQLQALGREHARLAPIVRLAERLARAEDELSQAHELTDEPDAELAGMAQADVSRLTPEIAALNEELHQLLLPRDPLDDRDAIMEVRAGTGGDEAALFAADLYPMYPRYCERHRLRWGPISLSEGAPGGLQGGGGGLVRGRSLRDVPALLRPAPFALGADLAEGGDPGRSKGGDRGRARARSLRRAARGARRASRPGGSRHRDPGA